MISFTTDVLAVTPAGIEGGRTVTTNDAGIDSLFQQQLSQAQSQTDASSKRRENEDNRSNAQPSPPPAPETRADDKRAERSESKKENNADRPSNEAPAAPVEKADADDETTDEESVETLIAPVAIVETPRTPEEQVSSEIVAADSEAPAEIDEPEMSKLHGARATKAAIEGQTPTDATTSSETPETPETEAVRKKSASKPEVAAEVEQPKELPEVVPQAVAAPVAEEVAITAEAPQEDVKATKQRPQSKTSSRRQTDSQSIDPAASTESPTVVAAATGRVDASIEGSLDQSVDSIKSVTDRSAQPAPSERANHEAIAEAAQEFQSELEAATENQSTANEASAGALDDGEMINTADRVRFVQRVARAFHTARGADGEIRLRLSPPELGSLRVELKVEGGALTGRIEAETPAARALLLDNLPALRDRLMEQNIKVERFDVDLMQHQPQGQPHNPNPQHEHELQRQFRRHNIRTSGPVVETQTITAERGSVTYGAGTLNVVI